MDRSVLRQRERYQLSYELPHEAYTSHVYPRKSANGSTVIVYGHERGVRIVWFAGKNFKPPKKQDPSPKTNGTTKTDPMIIDLDDGDDDEQPASKDVPVVHAEFEEEEDEIDPMAPYRDILRLVDIPLGSAALRIATPHIAKDIAQSPPESWPSLYLDHILVTVACADLSLRVITAPLNPPSPDVHELSKFGIQSVKLFGPNSHQEFISDIAVTHTIDLEADQAEGDVQVRTRHQTRSQTNQAPAANSESLKWSFLIASISCTGSGLLLVHQIPWRSDSGLSGKSDHLLPIRRQYLRSSAVAATLAFNPCPYPAERHSSLLLTLPKSSAVKLYQPFPPYARDRRGSAATSDSTSSRGSLRATGSDNGKILTTFVPPLVLDADLLSSRRKSCLDARWIIGGRAILALLEDGEWGIWDLEAVGPTSLGTEVNHIRGKSTTSGLQGGSITKFAMRSNVLPSEPKKKSSSVSQAQPSSGSLAPMTPSTRKARSEGLFRGSSSEDVATNNSQKKHGSIWVEEHHGRPSDESVVISYCGTNLYAPSVLSLWKAEIKPFRLPFARLGGQEQLKVAILAQAPEEGTSKASNTFGVVASSVPNFFVQTTHRLILSVGALSYPAERVSASATENQDLLFPDLRSVNDQVLLNSGELGIDGMDRILNSMDPAGRPSKPAAASRTKLTFNSVPQDAEMDDDDVDMEAASPTPSKYSTRSANVATGRIAERKSGSYERSRPPTQRRIFS